jgi:hypothetical protein
MRNREDGVLGVNAGPSDGFCGEDNTLLIGGNLRTLPEVGRSERAPGGDLSNGIPDTDCD